MRHDRTFCCTAFLIYKGMRISTLPAQRARRIAFVLRRVRRGKAFPRIILDKACDHLAAVILSDTPRTNLPRYLRKSCREILVMSNPVENTIRGLRDSPLYQDNEFVQGEDFPDFVRRVVTHRDDGMPELVRSILDDYFEHKWQEQESHSVLAEMTEQIAPQRPVVKELLDEYADILFQRLADLDARRQFEKEEEKKRGQRLLELPEANKSTKDNTTKDNTTKDNTTEDNTTEDDTKKSIEKRLAKFRQEYFDKNADKKKAIQKDFPFLDGSAFREVLQEILNHTKDPSHCRHNAFPLFHVLTQLSLMQSGTLDLRPTKEMLAINQRLDKYKNVRSDSGIEPQWYTLARNRLQSASKALQLPPDFFIKLLNCIADREDFRLVVLRQSLIVDPVELAGQLFEQELRIGGRAGNADETPNTRELALNAAAARSLNVILPEYFEDRAETIFGLMKSMKFAVTKESVQRNVQRASDHGSDHERSEKQRLIRRGYLFWAYSLDAVSELVYGEIKKDQDGD